MSEYTADEMYAWCVRCEWFEQSMIDEDVHYQKARIEVMIDMNRIASSPMWA